MGSFIFMLSLLVVLLLVLLVPLYIQINAYFDVTSGKVGCVISLYGKIKLVGGYFSPCPNGFAFHISNRKAILFSYNQMHEKQKQFSSRIQSKISSIQLLAEIGPEYLLQSYLIDNFLKLQLFTARKEKIFHSKICLKNSDAFRIFLKVSIKLQLLSELFVWIKYLFRRGTKQCRKIKSAI